MGAWPGSGWNGAFPDLMPVGSLSSVPPARDATLPVIEWESPEGRGDNMTPGCQNTLVPSPINSSSCGSAACCGIIPGYSQGTQPRQRLHSAQRAGAPQRAGPAPPRRQPMAGRGGPAPSGSQ